MNNRNQTGLHRAQTWEAAEEDDFRVKTVGEFRVPLLGRRDSTCQDAWILDYTFVAGTFDRLAPDDPWLPRSAGEAHLHPPGASFWSRSDPSFHRVSHSIYVIFEGGNPLRLQPLLNPGASFGRFWDPDGILGRRLRVLLEIGVREGPGGFWKAQATFLRVLDLLRHQSRGTATGDRLIFKRRPEGGEAHFAMRVDHLLRSRIGENLTREAIAGSMGVSVSELAHRYRLETGVSPMQRFRWFRIEAAKLLLREGVPIKQAAAAIGCGDAFQFSRLFKRTTGLPPSRFLEQAASEG